MAQISTPLDAACDHGLNTAALPPAYGKQNNFSRASGLGDERCTCDLEIIGRGPFDLPRREFQNAIGDAVVPIVVSDRHHRFAALFEAGDDLAIEQLAEHRILVGGPLVE